MDLSKLTDEELDKAIENPEAAAEAPAESTPAEEPVEKAAAEQAPAEEPAPEEPSEEPEEKPVSRREQLRVQQLLKKYGPPPSQEKPQEVEAHNYRDIIDAEDETINTLEADRQSYGQTQRTQGRQETLAEVQSVKWETLLHVDAPQMEAKYKVLDPNDTENFHPALSNALTARYLNMVGYNEQTGLVSNPNIRWKDFVEAEFELADEIAATRTASTTKNIAKQAASTGLRPDGSSAKRMNLNQAPQNMSDEELDAVIAQAIPNKR